MAASANNIFAASLFSGSHGCRLSTYRNGDFAMKIRPLHDRVIVKRMEEERKTASGIVIPDTAAEKPDQGEIIAVGTGKKDDQGKLIPLDVKVGDRVLFGKYAGQTVKVEGEELLVMREEDIMGVVEQ
jgi:chaperonin GroES